MGAARFVVVVGAIIGCKKAAEPVPVIAGSGSGSGSGSAVAVTVAVAVAVPSAVKPFPKVTGEDDGFLFADVVGGTVPFELDDKTKTTLPEGTIVTRVDGGEHDHTEDWTHVKAGDKTGYVTIANVIHADDIHPSPKQPDYALVLSSAGCGDYCHAAIWLAHGMGEHTRIVDAAVAPTFAWNADGKTLAVSTDDGAVLVDLATGKTLTKFDHRYAPAYSPDNTLYLRDPDNGVYKVDAAGKVVRVMKGKKEKHADDEYPPPPEPVTFDAAGKFVP